MDKNGLTQESYLGRRLVDSDNKGDIELTIGDANLYKRCMRIRRLA